MNRAPQDAITVRGKVRIIDSSAVWGAERLDTTNEKIGSPVNLAGFDRQLSYNSYKSYNRVRET
jgi:hypothetical protein